MARHTILLCILASVACGCHSTGPNPGTTGGGFTDSAPSTQPADTANPAAAPKSTGKPAAYINSESVTWNDMQPSLAEAAGGLVLVEEVLDRGITRRLHDRGLTLGDDQLKAEQKLLMADLSSDPDEAQRMVN